MAEAGTPEEVAETVTDQERHATERPPVILVLHGARGDLARRLVIPSLATLHRRGLLPDRWALVGTGREGIDVERFTGLVRESLTTFGDEHTADDDVAALTRHAAFTAGFSADDAGDLPATLEQARRVLTETEELSEGTEGAPGTEELDPADVVVVHYLAVPPTAFEPIARALGAHGLTHGPDGRRETVRVVFEKPYGTSPESFRELDDVVHQVLDEQQVFRIDHFLGKEATQNLHVARFGNELLRGVWNRRHVAQVQIDVPETLGVAQRAEFYDATGAALDMIVTHLFQVAGQVAMEAPANMSADGLVAARESAIADFRPLDPARDVVLGQLEGYRDIEGVADGSTTDTFVAVRLWVDNDRWRGVPFLLRTGKRMAASAQKVTLLLRRDPEELFGDRMPPSAITVSLAGDGAIDLTLTVKEPGPDLALVTGTARLDLDDVPGGEPLPAYASLLDDVLHGDRTLFTTGAGVEAAWEAFAPMLDPDRPDPLPYAPGSWGPSAAEDLAAPHGWVLGPGR